MIEIILVRGFCPLKIRTAQFPNGFRLNPNFPTSIRERETPVPEIVAELNARRFAPRVGGAP